MVSEPHGEYQAIWSPALRLLHWTLAISMIASFVTHEGAGRVHEVTGYVAWAAASIRVGLGFFAGGFWRFAQFVRGAKATWRYLCEVVGRRECRFVGHNPLGAWMVIALLADAIATGFTGWLSITDRFWGIAWVQDLHGALGHALLPLLVLHLAGVIFTSFRQRENLVASMLHGRKRVGAEQAHSERAAE